MTASPTEIRKPKQARAIRTRQRILDQAEQAFADKGFEAASLTSDILDPAGISVGSFYHQFPDKRAVLFSLLEERRSWREATNAALAATSAERTSFVEALRHAVVELLDDIDERPATWWIHFREANNADLELRAVVEQSWEIWLDSMNGILEQWSAPTCSPTRRSFVALGLAGVLRRYVDADDEARRALRTTELDEIVAAAVAALT